MLARKNLAVEKGDGVRESSDRLPEAHAESDSLLSASAVAISPSNIEGFDSIKNAGNREMLLFAQGESSLLRRQEAIFRKASAWIANVPEARREGVRQAVMVYAQNVRAWQAQAKEQEQAFLAARERDQEARGRFLSVEKSLAEPEQKKRPGFMARLFGRRRSEEPEDLAQMAEQAAIIREALHDQGLAIYRYMRFHSEWERSLEEMMAFVAEQMDL